MRGKNERIEKAVTQVKREDSGRYERELAVV